MKKLITLGALVLALGCKQEAKPELEKIRGLPLATSLSYAKFAGAFSVAIRESLEDKNHTGVTLAYVYHANQTLLTQAQALVQSEIADGDDDTITLIGNYTESGSFQITELTANSYTVSFK